MKATGSDRPNDLRPQAPRVIERLSQLNRERAAFLASDGRARQCVLPNATLVLDREAERQQEEGQAYAR